MSNQVHLGSHRARCLHGGGLGVGGCSFATRAADAAGNWEAIPTGDGDAHTFQDTTSPTSSASSPAASSTPTFTVTWSGSADAVSYDVQVQVDGGSSRCA